MRFVADSASKANGTLMVILYELGLAVSNELGFYIDFGVF